MTQQVAKNIYQKEYRRFKQHDEYILSNWRVECNNHRIFILLKHKQNFIRTRLSCMGNLINIIFMNNDCNMVIDIMPICFVADGPSISNRRNTYSHKKPFLGLENINFTSELFIFENQSSFFKPLVTTLGMKNSVYLIRHLKS